ncbi:MAG: cyclic nucleotide-binding domain-containing protein [Elusimicrobia bacterium]|nr:cyclic nucleotide-binding domain-containing protein [Elusimicrobiota bacterium]
MMDDKVKLIKSVRLLDGIPEKHLTALAEFLRSVSLEDGAILFDEGSKGDCLYFISAGQVRISKRVSGETFKDLAIMGPGDCFGEMALIDDVVRSARATAVGAAGLFELRREDLHTWLGSHPELAMEFFAALVQEQSRRLRVTSTELALLYDLSNILLDRIPTAKELLVKVVEHVTPHLQGSWAAQSSLYNIYNQEMEFVSAKGTADFSGIRAKLPAPDETHSVWVDEATYYVSLPGAKHPLGFLLFRSQNALTDDSRSETGRTLATVAKLLSTALENIEFRTEDSLRDRLKQKLSNATGL